MGEQGILDDDCHGHVERLSDFRGENVLAQEVLPSVDHLELEGVARAVVEGEDQVLVRSDASRVAVQRVPSPLPALARPPGRRRPGSLDLEDLPAALLADHALHARVLDEVDGLLEGLVEEEGEAGEKEREREIRVRRKGAGRPSRWRSIDR